VSQGWQKHFSFGQAKQSAGIMHLSGDYSHKAFNFDDSTLCAKHALVRPRI